MDVYVDTSIKNIPTKVANVGQISLTTSPAGGNFVTGDVLTGQYGLTTTVFTYSTPTNRFTASIPNITSVATSIYFANLTNIATNDYVALPNLGVTANTYEIVTLGTITSGTHLAAVTRARFGTIANEHPAGGICQILRPTATTTTLTAAITDVAATTITVASATGLAIGNYLLIGSELLQIQGITGTTLTVTRSQFSTTAATALNGATVTYITDQGRVVAQYFDSAETLTIGGITGTVSTYTTTTNPFAPELRFIFDINNDTKFEDPDTISVDQGRTYRFTQSDSSNTGLTLRLVATGSTSEYTTGVTISGTAGTSGAYTELVVSSLTANTLSTYSGTTSEYNVAISKNSDPTYTQAYIYDIDGSLTVGESFSTTTGTNEIGAVYPGPYGYVHSYSGTDLKVSLGLNSGPFVDYTTTITGSSGASTITVGSATNLAPGMRVTGTGIATNARILSISGTTLTLDNANTAAVSGNGTFKPMFYDTPRQNGSNRGLALVSSYTASTDINAEDYLVYDKSISANTVDKNSGIVVGPGQSLVVYSSTTSLNFVLNGFEDSTSDFTVNLYNRI